ncbi:competence protein CoiA [Actinotalea sp. K2]|uniref:competence protein CoiA n=1 Tax=Actinotalea sp. K2 TaxID=2939438 RepID=UPI002017B7BC|nr:competence protein CoiA [Actinotalea sp. K2]MCL3862067.1 competence protein CoiA [Actinotalea sp. K2]
MGGVVPLVALADGNRVVSTFLDSLEWDALRRDSRQGLVTLPGCGTPAYLRRSRAGLQHFVHQPGTAAGCSNHEAESPAHLRAKALIVDAARAVDWEAEPEVPGPGYVADVLAARDRRRVVFEVQMSEQAGTDYRDRTAVRVADGVEVVWLASVKGRRGADESVRPDATMPLVRLAVPGDPAAVRVGADVVATDDFVQLYLTGRISIRTHVSGPAATKAELMQYPCYRCGDASTVWRVDGLTVEGRCGLSALVPDRAGGMWATERPEADSQIQQAVRDRVATAGWALCAALSLKTSGTAGQYLAFSCAHCDALFGDWPLRSEWMNAAYVDGAIIDAVVPAGEQCLSRTHWCRERGYGLCENLS